MRNLIRRTASRQIYKGKLVRLSEDSVVLPRGTETIYESVEIKKRREYLAMEGNGDVWLVREWKYAIDRPSLEVVSGGIEPEEEPIQAACGASCGGRRGSQRGSGFPWATWIRSHR